MPQAKQKLSADQVVAGLFWTASGKGAVGLLQFAALVILARLVSPQDFGVIGAATIVVGLSEIITELGLGAAIVQRKDLEPRHLATAFTTSLVLGFAAGFMIYSFAPFIAGFFNSTQVDEVLRFLSWLFPIRSLASIGEAMAQRELRFRLLATTDVVSFAAGYFVFGVGLAFLGYGVWALATAIMAAAAFKSVMLFLSYPPKSLMPQRKAFAELLFFGGGHSAARISNYLALQGDNLVVGRFLGLYSLGIYGRAYQLMVVPASIFGQILDRVLFPTMAKLQTQKERLSVAYLRSVGLVAIVMLPASLVGIILAPEIVRFALGENWSEVVLPFSILLVGLLMRTSYKLSDSLARATGAVYRRAWRQAVYAAMVIGGAWLGHFWGVAGVAVGVLAAVTINFLLMAQMSLKLVDRTWRDLLAAHTNALLLAIVTAIAVYPPVYLLRSGDLSAGLILSAVAVQLFIMGILILSFAPRILLGADGIWLLTLLQSYIPESLRRYIYREDSSSRPYGAKDASAENA